MVILLKLTNILRFLVGFIPSILFYLILKSKNKKIVLVKLFSSKFGHFYANTEYFLRKEKKNSNFYIFFNEQIIDNLNLLEAWKTKILIIPYFMGFTLFKLKGLLSIKYYNCRKYSSIDRKSFLRRSFLTYKKINNNFSFTCSVRNNFYQKKNQVNDLDYQNYRDTNIKNFNFVISKFLDDNKKMSGTLINSNARGFVNKKFIKNSKFYYNKSSSFFKLLSLISSSSFHFGSSTGVDTLAFSHNIPTALYNMILGSSFNFINYPTKCIISPCLLIEKKNEKILSLKKHIELINLIEKKFKKDRFDLEDQIIFDLEYRKNSIDEMYNLLNEISLYSQGLLKVSMKDKKLQKKFWSIYPEVKKDILTKKILSDQRVFKPLISPYYLKKYEKVLF